METIDIIHQVGPKFNLDIYLQAREICKQTLNEVISKLEIGMNSADITQFIKDNFKNKGADKFWHPTKVRIDADTLKEFRPESDQSLRLKSDSICFIDIGPIINDHEADFGRTIVINPNQNPRGQKLIESTYSVFQDCEQHWKSQKATGIDLLNFASQRAQHYGFEIDPSMAGHRLGDFPHQVFTKADLFEIDQVPVKDLWVLEIKLLDRENNQAAFYEDILTL